MGWSCLSCGELITSIEYGRDERLIGENTRGTDRVRGLRLVHIGCCYDELREFRKDRSLVEGLQLERFVGPDGLMHLQSLIDEAEMPRADLLELAKRVQIPGYEQPASFSREQFTEEQSRR
jgi:hypothetical protein